LGKKLQDLCGEVSNNSPAMLLNKWQHCGSAHVLWQGFGAREIKNIKFRGLFFYRYGSSHPF
jgi:hypothetical protein